MLKIVDLHVLRQVSLPLVGAMVIGLLMLLAERLVQLLDTTLGKKNSFAVVFELLAYLVPHYLSTAIPAALFLGLLMGFNKMSANSETDAFMACGVGLHRLARPVILLGVLLAVLTLAIMGWVQPQARYAYRALLFDIQNVDVFYLAEEGVFMQAGDRTFIIDELDRGSNAFRRAFIFQDKGDKGSETVTSSRGFLYDAPEEGKRPILRLEEGHRLLLPRPPGRPGEADANAEVTEFAVADTPMGRVSKDIFRPRGIDERELTLPELFAHLDDPPEDATAAEVSSELNEMLVIAVSMLILPFLAIPFAVGSRRSPRSFRMGFALVLIVVYNEVIQQGSNVAQREVASSFVVMWIPCILLALFAFWRYYTTCFTLKADLLAAGLDRMGEAFTSFRHRLMRRTGLEEAR